MEDTDSATGIEAALKVNLTINPAATADIADHPNSGKPIVYHYSISLHVMYFMFCCNLQRFSLV